MEDASGRWQYPVGGDRENGVTLLSKVCSETKTNSLALDKVAVKFFSIRCIPYIAHAVHLFVRGNANIRSFLTLLESISSIPF